MNFSSKHEENQYKKWLKSSPFNEQSKEIFGEIFPDQESCLKIFRQEKENTKDKIFLPFNQVYQDSFLSKLPSELSEEQKEFVGSITWSFIHNKIDAMNKILEKGYGLLDKKKNTEALELFKHLADAGHPEACYLIAAYSLQGDIEERKYGLALEYANKALEFVAHPRSCLILAELHYQGFGVEANRHKAITYVLQAERTAESDPSVYVILAEYYQDGYIVHRDVEKVAHYSFKAEQSGAFL